MNPQNTPYSWRYGTAPCAPCRLASPIALPPAKYEFWKDIVLNFDPRDMF